MFISSQKEDIFSKVCNYDTTMSEKRRKNL